MLCVPNDDLQKPDFLALLAFLEHSLTDDVQPSIIKIKNTISEVEPPKKSMAQVFALCSLKSSPEYRRSDRRKNNEKGIETKIAYHMSLKKEDKEDSLHKKRFPSKYHFGTAHLMSIPRSNTQSGVLHSPTKMKQIDKSLSRQGKLEHFPSNLRLKEKANPSDSGIIKQLGKKEATKRDSSSEVNKEIKSLANIVKEEDQRKVKNFEEFVRKHRVEVVTKKSELRQEASIFLKKSCMEVPEPLKYRLTQVSTPVQTLKHTMVSNPKVKPFNFEFFPPAKNSGENWLSTHTKRYQMKQMFESTHRILDDEKSEFARNTKLEIKKLRQKQNLDL